MGVVMLQGMEILILQGMEILMEKNNLFRRKTERHMCTPFKGARTAAKELSLWMMVFLLAALLAGCGNAGGGSGEKTELSGEAGAEQSSGYVTTSYPEETDNSAQHTREENAAESVSETGMEASEEDTPAMSTAAESGQIAAEPEQTAAGLQVIYGDEREDIYLPLLEGKRVAVFSNQTGIVGNRMMETESEETAEETAEEIEEGTAAEDLVPFGQNADGSPVEYGEHILDALVRQGVDVTEAFSPEHGFRGTEDAGAAVNSYVDEKTGVPVISLYGSGSMYPSDADLDRFDTLVIDIQDVGLRFYTYYISMYYLMDACAGAGKEVVILDRPNPNGFYVDGPILQDGFFSGIGMLPIPVVHGMTLGELAQMINGEGWLSAGKDACSLTVVPCENYMHDTLTALVTRPSPNLKDMRAVYLYPSTCLFEKTACSVGRGTMHPFEIFGSPWLEGAEGYEFTFTPEDMEGAHSPVFEGQTCYGKDLRGIPLEQILQEHFNLEYVIDTYNIMKVQNPGISFFGSPDGAGHYWIDYLCGTDRIRLMIEEGRSAEEISASWQEDVEAFKAQRRSYLLYEE